MSETPPKNQDDNKIENKGKILEFLFRLKKIKHLDIILTILFIAIILLIYFSSFSTSSTKDESNNESKLNSSSQMENEENVDLDKMLLEYTEETENKLESIVSNIKGAGKVKVIVSFQGSIEMVVAYSTKTEISSDGTKIETKTPVLVTNDGVSNPIILQMIMPEIKSIVVVASGANDTNVKLNILRAIQTIYSLSSSKIEIFAGC